MLPKVIKYTDYNDVEREETFYFNLSQSELVEMQLGVKGTFSEYLKKIVSSRDVPELMATVKNIILKAYGEKSADGKRFIKSDELAVAFSQTEAYTVLFTELMNDENAISDFIIGIMPKALQGEIRKESDRMAKLATSEITAE